MGLATISNLAIVVIGELAIACFPLLAETAATPASAPKFEVASIHQDMNPNPRWNMHFTPDGLHATDVTLLWALQQAYGLYDSDL